MPAAQVSAVWAYQARYRVPLNKAVAGSWVLLEGVDATSECCGCHNLHVQLLAVRGQSPALS